MKNILLIGTFDFLHAGHINLFYNASKHGNVFVCVTSDALNERNESKDKLMFNEGTRVKMIKPLAFIEDVVIVDPDNGVTLEKIVAKYNINAICHGSDYANDEGKKNLAKRLGVELIILDRTEGISSSELRSIKNSL